MVVEEMNILTTVFLRADNMKIVFPNSTLATRPIGNFYRSPDMGDAVEFLVHIATPAEKIAMIRQRILRYGKAFSHFSFCSLPLCFTLILSSKTRFVTIIYFAIIMPKSYQPYYTY